MKLAFMSGLAALTVLFGTSFCAAPLVLRGQTAGETAEATAFARAQQAEKAGDYRTAEQIYQQMLREHPGQLAAEVNLGLAYYMDRRYADSSVHLLKALQTNPEVFPALMVAGVDFMKLGNPQRAVPLLRRARKLQPKNEYVNHNLASAEYLAGDYLHACADYVRYLSLPGREKDDSAWYGLGEASLLLGQRVAARLGKLQPSNTYRLRFLATAYMEQREWGLALARLRQLKANPGWGNWARLQMAEIDLRRGNFAQAAESFRQALAAAPESARAHYGLGVSLLLDGKMEAALPELVKAARDPWLFASPESLASQMAGHQRAVHSLQGAKGGSALVNAFLSAAVDGTPGHRDEHLAAFRHAYQEAVQRAHQMNEERLKRLLPGAPSSQRVLKTAADFLDEGDAVAASEALDHLPPRPKSVSSSLLQARVKAAQNDPLGTVVLLLPFLETQKSALSPEAEWWASTLFQRVSEMALGQVVKIAPHSAYAHLLKAQMEDAHHQSEVAIREFRLAVQVSPADADARFRLGEALWRAGHFQQAIPVLREGVKLDTRNAAAWYEIGDSYLSLAKPGLALPNFIQALKLNPEFDAAAKDLGTLYLHQGKFQQSVVVLSGIASRDTDGSVHYLLFRAYAKLGDKTRAAACLKRFQELKAAAQNQDLFNAETAGRVQAKAEGAEK
ncbi:MAG TPA: tetratricopeptide repeat protein [Terriglobia bacterium]|nr:tetratricopeptide repeat protein [Terriglobia bacterium]